MYALIDTKGANTIAIHIPGDTAAVSLPMLAAMLEHNATFINKGWRDASIVKPHMSIHLGDDYIFDADDGGKFSIAPSDHVLTDDFTPYTPQVKVSYKEALEKKDKTIERANAEVKSLKLQLEQMQERLDNIENENAE